MVTVAQRWRRVAARLRGLLTRDRWLALAALVVMWSLVGVATMCVLAVARKSSWLNWDDAFIWLQVTVQGACYSIVGLLCVARRPRQFVGWLLVVTGFYFSTGPALRIILAGHQPTGVMLIFFGMADPDPLLSSGYAGQLAAALASRWAATQPTMAVFRGGGLRRAGFRGADPGRRIANVVPRLWSAQPADLLRVGTHSQLPCPPVGLGAGRDRQPWLDRYRGAAPPPATHERRSASPTRYRTAGLYVVAHSFLCLEF